MCRRDFRSSTCRLHEMFVEAHSSKCRRAVSAKPRHLVAGRQRWNKLIWLALPKRAWGLTRIRRQLSSISASIEGSVRQKAADWQADVSKLRPVLRSLNSRGHTSKRIKRAGAGRGVRIAQNALHVVFGGRRGFLKRRAKRRSFERKRRRTQADVL
jgi:hypothetical protein